MRSNSSRRLRCNAFEKSSEHSAFRREETGGRGPSSWQTANLLLIAPATANVIAELAHGLAAHPLAAIALATRAPILLAPAMNGKMWEHPATQENVETLKARGVEFIGPEEGMLACGYEGVGRLWKVDDIAFRAEFLLARQDNLIA